MSLKDVCMFYFLYAKTMGSVENLAWGQTGLSCSLAQALLIPPVFHGRRWCPLLPCLSSASWLLLRPLTSSELIAGTRPRDSLPSRCRPGERGLSLGACQAWLRALVPGAAGRGSLALLAGEVCVAPPCPAPLAPPCQPRPTSPAPPRCHRPLPPVSSGWWLSWVAERLGICLPLVCGVETVNCVCWTAGSLPAVPSVGQLMELMSLYLLLSLSLGVFRLLCGAKRKVIQ